MPFAVAGTVASQAGCLRLNETDATSFFRLAVSVTRDLASDFNIRQGAVDWPIDFTVIRPGGAVDRSDGSRNTRGSDQTLVYGRSFMLVAMTLVTLF